MVTDSDNRIRLAAVSEGVRRPLWSVMIPTFHCARFLHQTLESVLSQDPGPDVMQIEIVDDCSNNNNCFRSLSCRFGSSVAT
jgi:Glycosyl transferase family 2